MKVQAMIHSLGAKAEVIIKEQIGNNQYVAEYCGVCCTAIYNIFTGCYYVDDVYGIIG